MSRDTLYNTNAMRKNLFQIFSLLLIIIIYSQKCFGQVNLSGKWKANCVFEKGDNGSIKFCTICPHGLSTDQTTMHFRSFEMVFEKDYLNIIIDSISTKVNYKLDVKSDMIEFPYGGKNYKYKLLYVVEKTMIKYILKDDAGTMILIDKEL